MDKETANKLDELVKDVTAEKEKSQDEPSPPSATSAELYFRVKRETLVAAINVLSELPYKQVGNLVNELRQAQEVR